MIAHATSAEGGEMMTGECSDAELKVALAVILDPRANASVADTRPNATVENSSQGAG